MAEAESSEQAAQRQTLAYHRSASLCLLARPATASFASLSSSDVLDGAPRCEGCQAPLLVGTNARWVTSRRERKRKATKPVETGEEARARASSSALRCEACGTTMRSKLVEASVAAKQELKQAHKRRRAMARESRELKTNVERARGTGAGAGEHSMRTTPSTPLTPPAPAPAVPAPLSIPQKPPRISPAPNVKREQGKRGADKESAAEQQGKRKRSKKPSGLASLLESKRKEEEQTQGSGASLADFLKSI